MLLLSFPCISHLSGYCAKGQMFLMELTQHKVHCVAHLVKVVIHVILQNIL